MKKISKVVFDVIGKIGKDGAILIAIGFFFKIFTEGGLSNAVFFGLVGAGIYAILSHMRHAWKKWKDGLYDDTDYDNPVLYSDDSEKPKPGGGNPPPPGGDFLG